jgi:internalin A
MRSHHDANETMIEAVGLSKYENKVENMRFSHIVLLPAIILLPSVLPVRGEDSSSALLVPDENLRTVVLELKKKRQKLGDDITEEDLRDIYVLDANDRGIKDLTGLELCSNLGEAKLSKNEIQDVTPLAGCQNLQSLDLAHNRIDDIAPLAKLEKLQYLNVEHNQIGKLDGLEPLQALTSLYAAHNQIAKIEPVAKLKKLWTLDLDHNKIRDVSPIAGLSGLSSLGLAHNEIADVSKIPEGSGMYSTYLHGNRITDICPLVAMAKRDAEGKKRFAPFWRLYLAGNPIHEETKEKHLAELKEAGVRLNMDYDR